MNRCRTRNSGGVVLFDDDAQRAVYTSSTSSTLIPCSQNLYVCMGNNKSRKAHIRLERYAGSHEYNLVLH